LKIEDRSSSLDPHLIPVAFLDPRSSIFASRFLPLSPWFTEPVGALNHSVQHSADVLPGIIQFLKLPGINVSTIQGMVQPALRFHALSHRFK
jgi:hypothetical protein